MPDPNATPLRVLHLLAGTDAGGLSRYVYDLCAAMHADGHSVAVAGERGASHAMFAAAPWPFIDLPLKGGPVALRRAANRLRHELDAHPVDVMHTHYRRATLVARRAQRRGPTRPPILYTVHQPRISLAWGRRWLTDFGDHAHAPSRDALAWLTGDARGPADRVTVIPHGINVSKFPERDAATRAAARRALGIPDGATVAAFVGRFDVPKNPDWMIDAARAAVVRVPSLVVLMMGDGPHGPAVRRQAVAAGLAAVVRVLPYGDPLRVFQAADAVLVPSLREGFSLAAAEAMSVGVPVLRTDTGGAAEMIVPGVTGLATPVDRTAFAAAAAEFLSDRLALDRMGAAAAAHVRRHLTFDRQAEQTVALYRRLAVPR